MVRINGEEKAVAGKTLMEYLKECRFPLKRIAVECNGDIVPKVQYESRVLCDGDKIEIVSFVGGG